MSNLGYFKSTVLPFGLSSARYIFSKLFIPLLKHWRSLSMNSVVYLDDGLDVKRSEASSIGYSSVIRLNLASGGFLANADKSVWDPVQVIAWLGIVRDSAQGLISISESRLRKCLAHIERALYKPHLSARDLASVVGKLFPWALS